MKVAGGDRLTLRFILRRDDGLGGSMTQIYRAGLRGASTFYGNPADSTHVDRCIGTLKHKEYVDR